ncbi:MAG: hypothetical protein ACLU8F_00640 [Clostridia bacterium]
MKEEDMSGMIQNLSSMLNSKDMPENIKNALQNFTKKNSSDSSNGSGQEEENIDKRQNTSSNNSDFNINPEMLSNLVSMFNNSSSSNSNASSNATENNGPSIDMETLLKMKTIMEKMNNNKNDPRSQLLLSLKPYLKDSRKEKVEQYIKLFNMSKVLEVLNFTGGDKKK